MPSLLSNSQKTNIRKAIQNVTDTFMKSPIIYSFAGATFDRWNEDQENQRYFSILFLGLVEHTDKTKVVENIDGARDLHEIKLTFNLEDLERLGLITTDYKFIGNNTTDYFIDKGILYSVLDIYYDGPLDEKPVLVIITGKKSDQSIVSVNNQITNKAISLTSVLLDSVDISNIYLKNAISRNNQVVDTISDNYFYYGYFVEADWVIIRVDKSNLLLRTYTNLLNNPGVSYTVAWADRTNLTYL